MPAALEKILLQMLSKEPDGRPSLLQVRAMFDAALRSITPTMGVAVGPRPTVERAWTSWVAGGLVAAGVVAAGVYGYVTARRREAQQQPAPAIARPAATEKPAATAMPPTAKRAPRRGRCRR